MLGGLFGLFSKHSAEEGRQCEDKSSAGSDDEEFDETVDEEVVSIPGFEPAMTLELQTDQEDGEEAEQEMMCHRCKLFQFNPSDKIWKDYGVVYAKILRRKATGDFRLLCRSEGTLKIIANHPLLCKPPYCELQIHGGDSRCRMWMALDCAGGLCPVNKKFVLKFASEELADQFQARFDAAKAGMDAEGFESCEEPAEPDGDPMAADSENNKGTKERPDHKHIGPADLMTGGCSNTWQQLEADLSDIQPLAKTSNPSEPQRVPTCSVTQTLSTSQENSLAPTQIMQSPATAGARSSRPVSRAELDHSLSCSYPPHGLPTQRTGETAGMPDDGALATLVQASPEQDSLDDLLDATIVQPSQPSPPLGTLDQEQADDGPAQKRPKKESEPAGSTESQWVQELRATATPQAQLQTSLTRMNAKSAFSSASSSGDDFVRKAQVPNASSSKDPWTPVLRLQPRLEPHTSQTPAGPLSAKIKVEREASAAKLELAAVKQESKEGQCYFALAPVVLADLAQLLTEAHGINTNVNAKRYNELVQEAAATVSTEGGDPRLATRIVATAFTPHPDTGRWEAKSPSFHRETIGDLAASLGVIATMAYMNAMVELASTRGDVTAFEQCTQKAQELAMALDITQQLSFKIEEAASKLLTSLGVWMPNPQSDALEALAHGLAITRVKKLLKKAASMNTNQGSGASQRYKELVRQAWDVASLDRMTPDLSARINGAAFTLHPREGRWMANTPGNHQKALTELLNNLELSSVTDIITID